MTLSVMATALLSALLCGVYLQVARKRQILDVPNERSSHASATPGGGGVALMAAFALGLVLAAWGDVTWSGSFMVLSAAALLLSALGFIDDVYNLSMRLRLAIYLIVSLGVAALLLQPLFAANGVSGGLWIPVASLAMLWSLNLYNFMDGIDGIAALQAVLSCVGAALLTSGTGDYVLYCLLLAAAHCGFLVWNFPPARLFMGDAGSIPSGFLLAGLAVVGAVQGDLNPLCWLVLLAVFITDASWTLLWRIFTGQRFTEAHSLHAYQRLSRYWDSHFKVDMLLLAVNVLWLFPLALAVRQWPDYALFMVILAYLPPLAVMAKVGRLN